jgi:MFS family permease
MAFIDSTVINVAMPAIQANFHATVVDVQWVIESYGLLLAALILGRRLAGRHLWPSSHVRGGCGDLRCGFRVLRRCLKH